MFIIDIWLVLVLVLGALHRYGRGCLVASGMSDSTYTHLVSPLYSSLDCWTKIVML